MQPRVTPPKPYRGSSSPSLLVEVQALRAVAVLIVIAYHLWPTRLPGGFVGVDVFFAISGFLIIGHLVRERERTGRIDFAAFYARRARRLLPAAFLVLALTGVAIALLYPPRDWPQLFGELVGAVLYVENWVLAASSVDYLAQNTAVVSPVQHFWSLGVEEQFYLAWPVLLIVASAVAVRVTRSRSAAVTRRSALVAILIVLVASSIASVVHTLDDPAPAFFGTHVRAWEFAAGGLVSLIPLGRLRPRPASALAWSGVALIAASALLFTDSLPFPGWIAAIPVLGALLVIVAGAPTTRWAPTRLYALRPVQFLGGISYSLYLWHWPLLVLLIALLGRDLVTLERIAVGVATVVAAWLSTRFVENPVRQGRLSVRSPAWTAAAASIVTVALVVPFGLTSVTTSARLTAAREALEDAASGDTGCLGAASFEAECEGAPVPGEIVPSTDLAPRDDVNSVECWSRTGETALKVCSYGPESGTLRVALVGDSHSNQYLATLRRIAVERDWTVDVMGKTGCMWTGARQDNAPGWVRDCETWKAELNRHLTDTHYDVIVTSSSAESLIAAAPGSDIRDTTVDGFVAAWASQIAEGATVVAIADNPRARPDYLECIDRGQADAAIRCAVDQADAFPFFDGQADAVDRLPGAVLIDLTDRFCLAGSCPPVIGGVLVYRDPGHLTSTYARTLADVLYERIVAAIGPTDAPPP